MSSDPDEGIEIDQGCSLHPDERRLMVSTVASHLRGRHPHAYETTSPAKPPGHPTGTEPHARSRRHAALVDFTVEVLRTRGRPAAPRVRRFLDEGFDRRAVLAVLREVTLRRAELCSLSTSRVDGGAREGGSPDEAPSCTLPRAG